MTNHIYRSNIKGHHPPIHICTASQCQFTSTHITTILCKYCGSKNVVKYGKKGDTQYYLCKDCNHTFAWNNTLPGMRYPPYQIATAISLFYDGLSIDAIRRQLDSIYRVYPSDSTITSLDRTKPLITRHLRKSQRLTSHIKTGRM